MSKDSVLVESSISGLDVGKARELANAFLSGGLNLRGGAPEEGNSENDVPDTGPQTFIQTTEIDDSAFTKDRVQIASQTPNYSKELEEDDSDENGFLDEKKAEAKKKVYPKGVQKRLDKLTAGYTAVATKYNELVPKYNDLIDYAKKAETQVKAEQEARIKAQEAELKAAAHGLSMEASLIETAKQLVALQVNEARREYAEAAELGEHAKVADAIAKLNKAAQDNARIEIAEPDFKARVEQAKVKAAEFEKAKAQAAASAPKADKVEGAVQQKDPEDEKRKAAFMEKHKTWFGKDQAMMNSLAVVHNDLVQAKRINPLTAPDIYWSAIEERMGSLYPEAFKGEAKKKPSGGSPVLTPGSSASTPAGGQRELSDLQKAMIKASGKSGKDAEAFAAALLAKN